MFNIFKRPKVVRRSDLDQDKLHKIEQDFRFHLDHNYWFYEHGSQKFSTIGILQMMYQVVLWEYFNHDRKLIHKFMRNNAYRIITLAENAYDCIGDDITNKYNEEDLRELYIMRVRLACIIYCDIEMQERKKLYKNIKWHLKKYSFSFKNIKTKLNRMQLDNIK